MKTIHFEFHGFPACGSFINLRNKTSGDLTKINCEDCLDMTLHDLERILRTGKRYNTHPPVDPPHEDRSLATYLRSNPRPAPADNQCQALLDRVQTGYSVEKIDPTE